MWRKINITPDVKTMHDQTVISKSNFKKLAPYGNFGRLLLTANFKVTRQNLGQKSGPDKL